MGRTALKDTIIPVGGGPDGSAPVFVTAGSRIISSFYALHRKTSVFGEDVELFDPDRWNNINPGPWEFMPFGNGPRSCAGQHKALLEAAYLLVKMVKRFVRIDSRDQKEWAGEWNLVVKNFNGCKVALFSEQIESNL